MKKIECILQNKNTGEYLSYNFEDLTTTFFGKEINNDKMFEQKMLGKAQIFYSINEAIEYLKNWGIKKSDYNIIKIESTNKKLNDLIYKEAWEYFEKYKDNQNFDVKNDKILARLSYLDHFTKEKIESLSLKDVFIQIKENEKIDEIHKKQFYTYADRASILLLQENSKNEILINNLNASDGTCKVAIVKKSENLIPDYYKRSKFVINGKFKIMLSDCAENYSDDGVEIEGFYFIYQVGFSYIFEQLDN